MPSGSRRSTKRTRPRDWRSLPGRGPVSWSPGCVPSPCPSGRSLVGSRPSSRRCLCRLASRCSTCALPKARFTACRSKGFRGSRWGGGTTSAKPWTPIRWTGHAGLATRSRCARASSDTSRSPSGPTLALSRRVYSPTAPMEHFVIDVLAGASSACASAAGFGHGFKFCSVVGEIMADLVESGHSRHDVAMFRLARFASSAAHRSAGVH